MNTPMAPISARASRIGSQTIPNQMPAVASALEDRDEAGGGLLDLGRRVEALLLGQDRVGLSANVTVSVENAARASRCVFWAVSCSIWPRTLSARPGPSGRP